MKEGEERIVLALERIADALEKVTGAKVNPDRQITEEGYATHIPWNDYGKTGLSTVHQPITFMTTNADYIKAMFGNACEDDECQK